MATIRPPTIRRKPTRFTVQKNIHGEFPNTTYPGRAIAHPAFVTRYHPRRKIQLVTAMPWLGAEQPQQDQPLPAWSAVLALRRRSTAFDTLRVTHSVFPETPVPPTAQDFPAWLPPRDPSRIRATRFTLQRFEHNPDYPETPVAASAQGYPAWFTSWHIRRTPTYRKHRASSGAEIAREAPPVTPAAYPAWQPANPGLYRRPTWFVALRPTLLEFPETVTSSSDARPAPGFVTRYHPRRKLQRLPAVPVYPAPPAPPGSEEYPSWARKEALRRRSTVFRALRSPHPAEYPETPVTATAQGYPAWQLRTSIRVTPTYRKHRSGGGAVPANPAQPITATIQLRAIRRKPTRFKIQTAVVAPVYPETPVAPPEPIAAWALRTAIKRIPTRFTHQGPPHPPVYPATPPPPSAEAWPSWQRVDANRRDPSRFDALTAPPPWPALFQPTAQGWPSWKRVDANRRDPTRFRALRPLIPPEYPQTPPVPEQPMTATLLKLAIRRRSPSFWLRVPLIPPEYPETPYVPPTDDKLADPRIRRPRRRRWRIRADRWNPFVESVEAFLRRQERLARDKVLEAGPTEPIDSIYERVVEDAGYRNELALLHNRINELAQGVTDLPAELTVETEEDLQEQLLEEPLREIVQEIADLEDILSIVVLAMSAQKAAD